MKTLEIIHLRLAGDHSQILADLIRKTAYAESGTVEFRIYRHTKFQTDLVVHLHRNVAEGSSQASDVGIRMASLLRGYGMVEHSVWVEDIESGDE